ncbi:hypothetical protein [Streptomyces sp. CAU 1734]|uniref:hypothetical protein n=1 Tax=Streptomyces sp. CAU 1734 TaxID=3140360 RepID=UPI003260F145
MNFPSTRPLPRTGTRLRLVCLVAVPVLALSAACGAGDGGGTEKVDAIADAPAAAEPNTENTQNTQNTENTAESEKKPGAGSSGKSAFYDAQMTYVQCMRAKGGYPDFPDPKLSGHPDWSKINEIGSRPGRNEGIKGGKNRACVDELTAVSAATPTIDQQKAYESMLAHAKCMRDNGVSRFINPTMSGGNAIPGGDPSPASPVLDPQSPAYKKAEKACAPKLLDGLDGMQ